MQFDILAGEGAEALTDLVEEGCDASTVVIGESAVRHSSILSERE
jgi:hypothetical protein